VTCDTLVKPGGWHHVAATLRHNGYNATLVQLYVDGKRVKEQAVSVGFAAPNEAPLEIGSRTFSPQEHLHLDGLVDDVRLYARVLSSAEIAALAH
jgi:hypothetical protein